MGKDSDIFALTKQDTAVLKGIAISAMCMYALLVLPCFLRGGIML